MIKQKGTQRKNGWRNTPPPAVSSTLKSYSWLESELNPKFAGERMWHNHPGRRDEVNRLAKGRLPYVAIKIVAIISAVGQIEHLKERRDDVMLFESEVLADSRIQLEVRLSAQIVERSKGALTRPETISVFDRVSGDAGIAERV